MKREIYVAPNGSDQAAGSKEQPLQTINAAAASAQPGDKIIVREGEYREWVKPIRGGLSEISRITYQAAPGEKVIIKGSEKVESWELVEGTVWKAEVPNTLFGDYNPYAQELFGDWFKYPRDWHVHAGDVYLNGKSFYEARNLEEVKNPAMRTEGYNPVWTKKPEPLLRPEDSVYQWYAEVGAENTVIYANFQGADPNRELTEINVRKCCFYPEQTGMDYITVRGFEMAQAACPYAPPTGDQPGLLGPNWSKGWIIEDNIIHDAKCSGISIGKEASTGDQLFTRTYRKPGYQYQMEAVFRALKIGWSKEKVGSHILRNNTIYDCGQNGIVGHMGCIFSEIYNNHIYNIAVKHEWYGYEIAGIKLHAAIDVRIHHNNLHNCTLGIWLDWQAQGTRVSKNLLYGNDRDLFVEVTHGPYLVDSNILGSYYNFDNIAQGGAYINNLCLGTMRREPVMNRSTPYHFPHSTEPMGTAFVYGGDDRWYQNIFVGVEKIYTEQSTSGTADYDGSPASLEEYIGLIWQKDGDDDLYDGLKGHAAVNRNAYFKGARAYDREEENYVSGFDPGVRIFSEGGNTWLEMQVDKGLLALPAKIMGTADLGEVRLVEAPYDGPDGKPVVLDTDYCGCRREDVSAVGPFAELKEGMNRILVWEE